MVCILHICFYIRLPMSPLCTYYTFWCVPASCLYQHPSSPLSTQVVAVLLEVGTLPGCVGLEARRIHRFSNQVADHYVTVACHGSVLARVIFIVLILSHPPHATVPLCLPFASRVFSAVAWVNGKKKGYKDRRKEEMSLTNITAY